MRSFYLAIALLLVTAATAHADASVYVGAYGGATQSLLRDLDSLDFGFGGRLGARLGRGNETGIRVEGVLDVFGSIGVDDGYTVIGGPHLILDSPKGTYRIGFERGSESRFFVLGTEFVTPVLEPSGIMGGLELRALVGKDEREGFAALVGLGGTISWHAWR